MDSEAQQPLEPGPNAPKAAGDAAHFELLWKLHQRPLLDFVYRKVRSRELAADLTQNAFAKAWKKRNTYNHDRDAADLGYGWLITIASNEIADHYRNVNCKKRKPSIHELSPSEHDFVACGDSPDEAFKLDQDPTAAMIKAERISEVQSEVAKLDEKTRLAIDMKIAGIKCADIAVKLDETVGNVWSMISRGFKVVRDKLNSKANSRDFPTKQAE